MRYKVYAIQYARREGGTRAADFYMGDLHDGPSAIAYYIWAIVGEDGCAYVVDAGFTPETSSRRTGRRTILCDPIEVLAALGVDARSQRDVLLTHLHYDHVGQYHAFPKARFWLQDEEMAFWTGRHANRAGYRWLIEPEDVLGLVGLNFEGRLQFVDGQVEVAPGVTLHRVGGHSPGLQVVTVQTGAGVVVLASDATHLYENIEDDRPFSIVHSLADMYRSFDVVRALAGSPRNIVPGHDPLVLERYPAVSPDLDGYAVEIAPSADRPRSEPRGLPVADRTG